MWNLAEFGRQVGPIRTTSARRAQIESIFKVAVLDVAGLRHESIDYTMKDNVVILARAREFLSQTLQSFESPLRPGGVLGEGDVKTPNMRQTVREAGGRRRLFATCIDALRDAAPAAEPGRAFSCVDRVLSTLPGTG